jgi:uncharacterized protein (DUF2062 family)
MRERDSRIVETAIEARGARLGRPVLVDLVISTLAVIALFALIFYDSFRWRMSLPRRSRPCLTYPR